MSSLSVLVETIDEVLPHPDPETKKLAVLVIGGYRTITAKKLNESGDLVCPYQPGDAVIYVPPDAIIPPDTANEWGVSTYLGQNGRVRTVRLRGFVSRGFVIPVEPIDGRIPQVGEDVADYYGITKYEPPVWVAQSRSEGYVPEIEGFHRYTDIERIQRYHKVLIPGEEVVVTEETHGTNSRVARLVVDGEPQIIVGTRRQRVLPGYGSKYEFPLSLPGVVSLLEEIEDGILFGEIYGSGIQNPMTYGYSNGHIAYIAFDIAVGGCYLNWDDFVGLCEKHNVPVAPVLYRGPFDMSVIEHLSDGPTTVSGDHVREGVVVHPVVERYDRHLGRVILKRIGDSYEVGQYEMSDSH